MYIVASINYLCVDWTWCLFWLTNTTFFDGVILWSRSIPNWGKSYDVVWWGVNSFWTIMELLIALNYDDWPLTWSAFRYVFVHPLTWWRCVCRVKQLLTDTVGPFTVLPSSWRRTDPGVCSEEGWPSPWGTYLAMDSTFCLTSWLERPWLRPADSQVSFRGNSTKPP